MLKFAFQLSQCYGGTSKGLFGKLTFFVKVCYHKSILFEYGLVILKYFAALLLEKIKCKILECYLIFLQSHLLSL
jgi:hypothetical protein